MSLGYTLMLIGIFCIIIGKSTAPARGADDNRTKSFYDSNGKFAGTIIKQSRDAESSYDRNGIYTGSAITNRDGSVSYYDRHGHFVGSRR
jgi:hypothetical protein